MNSNRAIAIAISLHLKLVISPLKGHREMIPPLWLLFILVLIIFLCWTERGSQDCLHRRCINATPHVELQDETGSAIDKTIETLRKNHTLVGWRRALLIALIVTIPIYYLMRRTSSPKLGFLSGIIPSGYEFFVIATIIFVITYFSSVWLNYVWFAPRDLAIEQTLLQIRRGRFGDIGPRV